MKQIFTFLFNLGIFSLGMNIIFSLFCIFYSFRRYPDQLLLSEVLNGETDNGGFLQIYQR